MKLMKVMKVMKVISSVFLIFLLLLIGLPNQAKAQFTSGGGGFVAPVAGQTPGTSTNDNACAGCVGEFVQSVITTATDFPANGVNGNLTSILLTPGDWDVTGSVYGIVNGATMAAWLAGVSTVSATMPTQAFYISQMAPQSLAFPVPKQRISIATTTTVYLVGQASYTGGPPQYACQLQARRVR